MIFFFAKIGFAMFFAAFLSSFLRVDITLSAAAVFALFGACLFFFDKKSRDFAIILGAVSLGCAIIGFELLFNFYPAIALDGHTAKISGTIKDVSAAGGNPVYTVETDFIDIEGAPQNIKIKVTGWEENSAKPFDKISCNVSFVSYAEKTDEELLSDRSRGISVYAYTKTVLEVCGSDRSSFSYYIYLIRGGISSVIYKYFSDWHAPFMEQLLIGIKGELPSEVLSSFRKSGMSHILAISGLHMSVLIGALEYILRHIGKEKLNPYARNSVLLAAVFFYMFIGGLGASIVRSGFMLGIHYGTKMIFRGSKSADNLGLAVAIILVANPMACCDAGFIMSAVSSLSLAVFAKPFESFVKNLFRIGDENPVANHLIQAVCVSIIPFLAVLPVAVLYFGEVSLLAPVSNIIAGSFASVSLVFGIFTVILGAVPFLGFFAGGTAFIAMICNRIMLETAKAFSFSQVEANSFWLCIWVIGSAVLIIIPALYSSSFRYIKPAFIMSAVLFAMGLISYFVFFHNVTQIDINVLEHGTAVSCSKGNKSVLTAYGFGPSDRFELDFDGNDYDVIISLDSVSGVAEADLVFASEPEFAMLTFDDSVARYKDAIPFETGTISLWKDAELKIISEGVFCAQFDEIKLLYISEKFDIMDIEPKFRKADIVILEGISPNEFSVLRPKYLILRKTEGYYSGASEIITLKEGKVSFAVYESGLLKGLG